MQHKKLSGILVESVILSHEVLALVIGFGININQQVFHDDLKDAATSLTLSTSKTYDKDVIYDALIDQFEKDYLAFKKDYKLTIDYCNKYHVLNGKKISYSDHHELKIAKVIKIQDDGTLLVIGDQQEIALSNKDISIVKV
ncbi:MAG: hypothetical protein CVV60_06780 [Tenericutes bacterium HGW-Tenericutes-5]|nr:MAG: hypothetical protein CVV60_06780 [Tenericutes bacterium HGW-Tenericutes-5]